MRIHGDELAPNQVVTVNGRPIQVDVKEADTEEGWVDVFFPILSAEEKAAAVGEVDTSDDMPIFDYEVRRLTGKVRVIELE